MKIAEEATEKAQMHEPLGFLGRFLKLCSLGLGFSADGFRL